ncbi:hypothetical protein OUZ56_033298 [Daphnia magna]|uniref:GMP synthase n=1 Tax=Daphnia magna TaxID=35525 RepID=A0ABR0BAK4_9CRUS|nr:hypothetical protein OUZ56_033298 [Daphnia magna]
MATRLNTLGICYGFSHDVETFKDKEVVKRKSIDLTLAHIGLMNHIEYKSINLWYDIVFTLNTKV